MQEAQFWCTRPAWHSRGLGRSCKRHFSYLACPSSVEVDYAEPQHGEVQDEKGDAKESAGVALACYGDCPETVEEASEEVLSLLRLQVGELVCRGVVASYLLISRSLVTD